MECFRNPFEIDFFKVRYSQFYLLSIQADKELRKKRIKPFPNERDKRDQGEDKKTGQLYKLDVRACVLVSDISLINNKGTDLNNNNLTKYFEKLLRYFALIREPGCIPPNDNELFMHLAYSMSLKSTCISRKVGAIVIGPKGYIYGAGWNDVSSGKVGCGLRQARDYKTDNCDFPKTSPEFKEMFDDYIDNLSDCEYICYKDVMSKLLIDKKLKSYKDLDEGKKEFLNTIKEKLSIKRLEYCRALHAEENALLQTAIVGGNSVDGGSIYTTTFPCELCAKKIYQTGIKTVYYTEPYPESISETVFLEDGNREIEIIPFEGVKSSCFYKLFKPVLDKKDYQLIQQ